MNSTDLNLKYSHVIEKGFTGVQSNFDPICNYLDRLLRMLVNRNPGFKFKQIRVKFGEACFSSNLHEIFNDCDRQRDHDISLKIHSKLAKQSNLK
ncbi:hypothetical protein CLV96_3893 [Leptospira meyeri]|uniref:Uncharacterized protein n=1 Tax=Leptospira meyeri TaxID=29508 RepID=A0A4R8MNP2_LEPME|nr:hypothetical protein CLV96_3893 [Leptospira meyeri]